MSVELCKICAEKGHECDFINNSKIIADAYGMSLTEKIEVIEEIRKDATRRGCPNSNYNPPIPENIRVS